MFVPSERWLSAFVAATRTVLRRSESPVNSCIEAGRIGVGVAQTFGYAATPVPVAIQATSPDRRFVLVAPGDAPARGRFAGHLVLHFAGDILIDLTADQFHQPADGLFVPGPITVPGCSRPFLAEGVAFDLPSGTTMTYRELEGDGSWQGTRAWTGPAELQIHLTIAELYRLLDTRGRKTRVSRARRS